MAKRKDLEDLDVTPDLSQDSGETQAKQKKGPIVIGPTGSGATEPTAIDTVFSNGQHSADLKENDPA